MTVTNAKIFDEPVFNYTRRFPFLWEEVSVPLSFKDDRQRAEKILLDVADKHTVKLAELGSEALQELQRRYLMDSADVKPRVYWRITDNWLEMTVRFVVRDHGVRDVKDKMSREILTAFDQGGIGIASATYEIVGLPRVEIAGTLTTPHDGAGSQQRYTLTLLFMGSAVTTLCCGG